MISKIRQMLKDHRAMNRIRANNGDCYLIATCGQGWHGFECELNQRNSGVVGPDPADAVLKAFWQYDGMNGGRK